MNQFVHEIMTFSHYITIENQKIYRNMLNKI
uniref:Uncharacterized protein n=1 Tax=Rhizophora mucronata TaxID=61149 RepID=A0A2P2NJL7_RHIMU